MIDIETIDPQQGTKFVLNYHSVPRQTMMNKLKSYYKTSESTLKSETYESRQIANIMDGYAQVMKLYDEQERELDAFLARSSQPEEEQFEPEQDESEH